MNVFDEIDYFVKPHASQRWCERAIHLHNPAVGLGYAANVEYAIRHGQVILAHRRWKYVKYKDVVMVTYRKSSRYYTVITVLSESMVEGHRIQGLLTKRWGKDKARAV